MTRPCNESGSLLKPMPQMKSHRYHWANPSTAHRKNWAHQLIRCFSCPQSCCVRGAFGGGHGLKQRRRDVTHRGTHTQHTLTYIPTEMCAHTHVHFFLSVHLHIAPTDITQLLQPLVTPTGGLPLPLAAALHRPEHGLQHLGAEGDARRLLNAELGRADLLLTEDA